MPRKPTPLQERFWPKVDTAPHPNGCWLWQSARTPDGYGVMSIQNPPRIIYAHRYSYELANGPIPAGMLICHHCDNPPCCNPSHLFLGTYADNEQDKIRKGRQAFQADPDRPRLHGESIPWSKLTWGKVREMRRLNADGVSFSELARRFNVVKSTARHAVIGKTWHE